MFKNRPYQDEAEKDIEIFLSESPFKKGIIVSPVGTGKALYTSIISSKVNKPVLVVQPNKELLEQNLEKAQIFGLDPTVYSASIGSKNISDLTYATPMSIASRPEDFKHFEVVAIDESHLMATNKLSGGKIKEKGKFVEFLESLDSKKVIGLTATPIQLVSGRSGSELKMMNRSMRSYWYKSDIFHATQIQDVYKDYWAEIDLEKVEINSDNKLRLNSTGNEFTTESIIKQYEDNSIDFYILEQYERLLSEGIDNILTFMPSVELAVNLAKKNPDFAVVYDKTPNREREAIVRAFKRGDISNLLNVNVFSCGFDHPALKGLIMARETNSFTVYYQQFGRLVRPLISNGIVQKTQKKLIDLTGNSERFGDIRGITFEKNDYTNGWGMWNADRLLTGSPFGNWNMPHRSSFIKSGTKKESIDDIIISFGKYKGRSLEKSFRENPGYFTWILNEFNWGKHNEDLKIKIEKLLKQNILHGS